ncbi:MAG: Ig domain-containing protein [Pontibacterium sp.]
MTRNRTLADLGSTSSSTSHIDVPAGTTAERPSSPNTGYLRFNTTIDQLEQYNSDGWQGISAPPTISSISPTAVDETATTQTVVVTGQNFDITATATLINNSGVVISPTTSTRNSSSQITVTFTGGDVLTTGEPFDVKVTNGSGLTGILEDALNIDETPNWSTAAGNVGTVTEDLAMSSIQLTAVDPEGQTVSYSLTSGALPTGVSLSTSGAITGTPNVSDESNYSSSGMTHNFTVTADDGTGNTVARAFNIIRKWRDGSTSALAAPNVQYIKSLGITTNGIYWINKADSRGNNTNAKQFMVIPSDYGGNWIMGVYWPRGLNAENTEYFNGVAGAGGSFGTSVSGYSGSIANPMSNSSHYYAYPAFHSGNANGTDLEWFIGVSSTHSNFTGTGSMTISPVGGNVMPVGGIYRNARLDMILEEDICTGDVGSMPSQSNVGSSADGVNWSTNGYSGHSSSGWTLHFAQATSGNNFYYNGSPFGGQNSGWIIHNASGGPNDIGSIYGRLANGTLVSSDQNFTAAHFWYRPTTLGSW